MDLNHWRSSPSSWPGPGVSPVLPTRATSSASVGEVGAAGMVLQPRSGRPRADGDDAVSSVGACSSAASTSSLRWSGPGVVLHDVGVLYGEHATGGLPMDSR